MEINPLKKERRIIYARTEMIFWYINIIFWPLLSGLIKPEDLNPGLIEVLYFISIVLTILSIHMILQCKKEIQLIFRYFDEEKSRERIQKQSQDLYRLNQAENKINQIIHKTQELNRNTKLKLAPIYPDKDGFVKKWVADEFDPTIINGFWAEDYNRYEIKCPAQLRDHIILMQNSIPNIFTEILDSKE